MQSAAQKIETQTEVDDKNRSYWNELCGSHMAQVLGITGFSPGALARFDAFFMGFYHYVFKHFQIDLDGIWNKKILEVGLGYGTVAQILAAISTDYIGLDIAKGPVELVNERMRLLEYTHARAIQGSILEPPLEPASFDAVVSIGCLHHTGNLPLAIEQIGKLTKPGGDFYFMLYNAYSYRRWWNNPKETFGHLLQDSQGKHPHSNVSEKERSAYDEGAPETVFTSARQARRMLKQSDFKDIRVTYENAMQEEPLKRYKRARLLRWLAPTFLGLEIYVTARKA